MAQRTDLKLRCFTDYLGSSKLTIKGCMERDCCSQFNRYYKALHIKIYTEWSESKKALSLTAKNY